MKNLDIDDYKKQWDYIYNVAFKLTVNQHEAEDLAQDTLITSWERFEQLKDVNLFKPWLRRICINKFLMKKRKEKGYKELSYDQITELENETSAYQFKNNDPLPEDEIIVDESIREMRNSCFMAMTRKLTLNQRMAFSLTDMFGMDIDEIAGIIGLSRSAAKSLLHRARLNIDSFFASKCNLIRVDNPCSCKKYIEFSKMKESTKTEVRKRINSFKFGEKPDNYKLDDKVRNKVKSVYINMPGKIPSNKWYESVIKEISKNII